MGIVLIRGILMEKIQFRKCDIPVNLLPYFKLKERGSSWLLRKDIIWKKISCLPTQVKDNFNSTYEHIFMFSKEPYYFFDQSKARKPYAESSIKRFNYVQSKLGGHDSGAKCAGATKGESEQVFLSPNSEGAVKGDVWEMNTAQYKGQHFACVDSNTEALTLRGWKKFYELTSLDQIAIFNGQNLKWEVPKSYVSYQYNGKMIEVSNRDIHMNLTPDHRVYYKYFKKVKGSYSWRIKRADQLKGGEKIRISASFITKEDNYIPPIFAELCGWILTDGHYCKWGNAIELYQTLEAHPEKVRRIRQILKILKFEFHEYKKFKKGRTEITFYIPGTRFKKIINPLNLKIREIFPGKKGNLTIFNSWNKSSLKGLYKGMCFGDAHIRKDKRITFSGNKEKLSFFSVLGVILGFSSKEINKSVYISYKTSSSLRGTNGKYHKISKIDYNGLVWCPQVSSGMWMARLDGRPFITGNCFPEELVENCIKPGCSKEVCSKCGRPKMYSYKMIKRNFDDLPDKEKKKWYKVEQMKDITEEFKIIMKTKLLKKKEFQGWNPTCKCNEPFVPGIVMDIFAGSGTSLIVARKLGYRYVGIEMQPKYIKIIENRMKGMLP